MDEKLIILLIQLPLVGAFILYELVRSRDERKERKERAESEATERVTRDEAAATERTARDVQWQNFLSEQREVFIASLKQERKLQVESFRRVGKEIASVGRAVYAHDEWERKIVGRTFAPAAPKKKRPRRAA